MWTRYLALTLLFASAVLSASVVMYVQTGLRRARSKTLSLLAVAALIYTIAVYLEFEAQSLEFALLVARGELITLAFVAPTWLLFCMEYANVRARKPLIALLFVVPLITCVGVLTCTHHTLFYSSIAFVEDTLFPRLLLQYGPLFYLHLGYFMLMTVGGMVLLLLRAVRGGRMVRMQVARMLGAVLLLLLSSAVYILGLFRLFDITALTCSFTCMMFMMTVNRSTSAKLLPMVREAAVDTMLDAWIAVDEAGGYMDANLAALTLFPELRHLAPGSLLKDESNIGWDILNVPIGTDQMEVQIPLGETMRTYRISVSAITYQGNMVGKTILLCNISQMCEYRQQLEGLATTDYLTGLLNRRGFFQLASREHARAERGGPGLSVISLDIDFFKQINDQYGHQTGDRMLTMMCNLFKSRLRKNDIFARFGGEEFIILLPDTPLQNAILLAERLRTALAAQDLRALSGERFKATASFGVASIDSANMQPLETLIQAADAALYEAKGSGRDCVRTCEAAATEM